MLLISCLRFYNWRVHDPALIARALHGSKGRLRAESRLLPQSMGRSEGAQMRCVHAGMMCMPVRFKVMLLG